MGVVKRNLNSQILDEGFSSQMSEFNPNLSANYLPPPSMSTPREL